MKRNQSGFASFEIVAVVAVLVIVGTVGYAVMKRNHKTTDTTTVSSSAQTKTSSVPSAPQIKSSSDLSTASKTLDETNLDASNTDSSQLNGQLSAF